MEQTRKIAFIGAGNMASCLIGGLINSGYNPEKIIASNPSDEKLTFLKSRFSIAITNDNCLAASQADVIILAVKPNRVAAVCKELSEIINKDSLVISVAAGIQTKQIQQWLNHSCAIIRCMPNTPALIGAGASGLFANTTASTEQKQFTESMMRAIGVTVWVDSEEEIDIVTAISGSGPAYFLYFFECIIKAGEKLGLSESTSRLLTLQTALGAARMALENNESVEQLRKNVTSPGGTTEHALEVLQTANLDKVFLDAISAAKDRAEEMADMFSVGNQKAIEDK